MDSIRVSVVMAVYNAEPYLRQALDSVVGQTLKDIEIICVDDGSTDQSVEILKTYAEKDDRIKILYQTETSDGAGKARNLGMSIAKGKYLSFLDADDFFNPDMLQKAYEKAETTHADMVIYDAYLYDDIRKIDDWKWNVLKPEALPKADVFSPKENAQNIFQMTIGAAWNIMYLRSFVAEKGLRFESIHHADDLGFVYASFVFAKKIAVIREKMMHYRRNNAGSQSANLTKWPEGGCEALYRLKCHLERAGLYEQYKLSFANMAAEYVLWYLHNMKDISAFNRLYNSFRDIYLGKLGLLDIADENYTLGMTILRLWLIKDLSAEEYLFEWYQAKSWMQCVPDGYKDLFPVGSRVAVYGAGARGQRVFWELMRDSRYAVCAWVDAKHEKIGYPVQNPESLRETAFDYVLIAILKKSVCVEVRKYLIGMGIPENKIVVFPDNFEMFIMGRAFERVKAGLTRRVERHGAE